MKLIIILLIDFRTTHPERLAQNESVVPNGNCEEEKTGFETGSESGPTIIGNVTIHPTAIVHPTAVVNFY